MFSKGFGVAAPGVCLMMLDVGPVSAIGAVCLVVAGGAIVVVDVVDGEPRRQLKFCLERIVRRFEANVQRHDRLQQRERELARIAREELDANYGVRLPEDLTPEDRDWVREQAALAVTHHP